MDISVHNLDIVKQIDTIPPQDNRSILLGTLLRYNQIWVEQPQPHASYNQEEESNLIKMFTQFVTEQRNCFDRSLEMGHITASAVVTNKNFDRVLLTLHKKLEKWLQLGGHADGVCSPATVAQTEVEEESGYLQMKFFDYWSELGFKNNLSEPLPFDFDRHIIPARKGEPQHSHYDVRYLIICDDLIPPTISEESTDLAWFDLDQARNLNTERSMERQFDKLEFLSRNVF